MAYPSRSGGFFWLSSLRKKIVDFYEADLLEVTNRSFFLETETEEFIECILLHSDNLQNDPIHTILDSNVILIRLGLSSGKETLLFILLDHQDPCWKKGIEEYRIALTWLVDSGRGMEDHYVDTELYSLMKQTAYPEILPAFYFKGLYNKSEIPSNFQFLYAMLSQPEADGYDPWRHFSAVYQTNWSNHKQ